MYELEIEYYDMETNSDRNDFDYMQAESKEEAYKKIYNLIKECEKSEFEILGFTLSCENKTYDAEREIEIITHYKETHSNMEKFMKEFENNT